MKRLVRLLSAVALVAAAFVGCGGQSSDGTNTNCAGARLCVAPDTAPTALDESPIDEIPVDELTGEPLGMTDKSDSPSPCGRPQNDYFSFDPACNTLSVGCLAPSVAFSDACGCGCSAAPWRSALALRSPPPEAANATGSSW